MRYAPVDPELGGELPQFPQFVSCPIEAAIDIGRHHLQRNGIHRHPSTSDLANSGMANGICTNNFHWWAVPHTRKTAHQTSTSTRRRALRQPRRPGWPVTR
ncbi:Uncharacterised protein [Mycobacteroides abscessus subsp. abscessus]|nr:Uncharacterised protein [Mycobacteroides abscessus subsp. abscessus]